MTAAGFGPQAAAGESAVTDRDRRRTITPASAYRDRQVGTGPNPIPGGHYVTQLKTMRIRGATFARILLVVVPLVLAACNKGGGSGY
jgi:hypothetical protein